MKKIYMFYTFIVLTILLSSTLVIFSGCSSTKIANQNNNIADYNVVNGNPYNTQKLIVTKPKEETIYSFSTQILDKEEGRQNNIRLTCSTLNGTIVKVGDTFSFCDTVGKATTERGYKEAKIFDANGNVTMGLGGGNCQVSSTLYAAILQDPNFEIIERHSHARKSILYRTAVKMLQLHVEV